MTSCFAWCRNGEELYVVKALDLSNAVLYDVPTRIFLFERTLESLNLSSNRITDLPTPLFSCQSLQELNLGDNKLNVVPPAIGQLTNLRSLDLSRNCVVKLPATITRCKHLSKVNLNNNPLKQLPECVTQLVALEELYLINTNLYFLPANMGRLTGLRILELRDNHLSSLPRAIHRCSKLRRLDLGQNDFTYVPNRVADLVDLEELWLDLNGMVALPAFIQNLKHLTHLDASENKLVDLPDEIGDCKMLTLLTLCFNDIEKLPARIGELYNLVTLKLDENKLKSLPENIGLLMNLEELSVSKNQLQELPPSIGLLRKLKCLSLDFNELCTLPPEIGSCCMLSVLTVQNNRLSSIPGEIGQLLELTVLSLANNQLIDLPMSVLKLQKLRCLWLVNNQSKPLTPLVKERCPRTGVTVLTCYLLPQVQAGSNQDDAAQPKDDVEEKRREKRVAPKIRFSLQTPDKSGGSLLRVPTPYPKKLRELAQAARALTAPPANVQPTAPEVSVVNTVSEMNALADQVRTALVVKKQPPSSTIPSGNGSSETLNKRPHPPPYHIAAASSKQYMIFHKTPPRSRRDQRSDIDSEALNSLKDTLLSALPDLTCQESQSEKSSMAEMQQYERSEADSAFIEPSTSYKQPILVPAVLPDPASGTFAALPGIVRQEEEERVERPGAKAKVDDWLSSRTGAALFQDEFSYGLNSIYPQETTSHSCDVNCNSGYSVYYTPPLKRGVENYIDDSPPKPSKIARWWLGNHSNAQVLPITLEKVGEDLGFEVAQSETNELYVTRIRKPRMCPGLRAGDKILQVESMDVKETNSSYIMEFVKTFTPPISIMISRLQ